MADAPSNSGDNRSAMLLGVRAINDLNATLKTVFPTMGATAGTATGGAATLPANPVGFLSIQLPTGELALIPYYAQ